MLLECNVYDKYGMTDSSADFFFFLILHAICAQNPFNSSSWTPAWSNLHYANKNKVINQQSTSLRSWKDTQLGVHAKFPCQCGDGICTVKNASLRVLNTLCTCETHSKSINKTRTGPDGWSECERPGTHPFFLFYPASCTEWHSLSEAFKGSVQACVTNASRMGTLEQRTKAAEKVLSDPQKIRKRGGKKKSYTILVWLRGVFKRSAN